MRRSFGLIAAAATGTASAAAAGISGRRRAVHASKGVRKGQAYNQVQAERAWAALLQLYRVALV